MDGIGLGFPAPLPPVFLWTPARRLCHHSFRRRVVFPDGFFKAHPDRVQSDERPFR